MSQAQLIRKPCLPLMKVHGPGLLKYDLSKIPAKLRKRRDADSATKSHKRRKHKDRLLVNKKKVGVLLKTYCDGTDLLDENLSKAMTKVLSVVSPQRAYLDTSENTAENTAYFPALQRVRPRGNIKADKAREDYEKCSKDSTRHPYLLPSIFTVFCEHGICYGFHIMENNESPHVPFTFMEMVWIHYQGSFVLIISAPSTIIYDNACNLHAYCLNRDPVFIKDTIFAVDNLHWRNHKSCSKVYHPKHLPALLGINTQMVEQNNAKLRKLKSQLSYMNHGNFINHLIFFFGAVIRNFWIRTNYSIIVQSRELGHDGDKMFMRNKLLPWLTQHLRYL
ncbi:uncharacterized protein LOC110466906 [Mizuhopecten yessoensis]|uniref:uncharacterized protein LOC110466906 n=1 Tax=Mizuhopecten yessoensis TaxID=6573 RepID=UPI000B4571BE|nr:uncharacterized protein LOC110466906 [Mizuhopecten yessoensis]